MTADVATIYRTHGHVVLRRARRLLGNDDDARDVLQQVFVAMLKGPDRFRGDSSVTTYLYRMTTNVCLQRMRNVRVRANLLDRQVAPAYALDERSESAAETSALVRQLVASLPDELAHVAIACFVDGMTHEEIAEQVGCTRRHAGNLVEAARRALQDCLKEAV